MMGKAVASRLYELISKDEPVEDDRVEDAAKVQFDSS